MEVQLWRKKLEPYELAVDELIVKFNFLIKQHRRNGGYSPIEKVTGRVKKLSSILDKMQKKNITFDEIDTYIEDIAGIRLICQFVEDIDDVVTLIKNRSDMKVITEKDYINNMKDSGYRSYHMIVLYNVETMDGSREIKVEFQIRTLAMDFWSTCEHSLQYKYKKNIPIEIKERLRSAADNIIALDMGMSTIRNEIKTAQSSFETRATLVEEILGSIQNMFGVANDREIEKIQNEFYKIYQSNDLEGLKRFRREVDILAESYKVQG